MKTEGWYAPPLSTSAMDPRRRQPHGHHQQRPRQFPHGPRGRLAPQRVHSGPPAQPECPAWQAIRPSLPALRDVTGGASLPRVQASAAAACVPFPVSSCHHRLAGIPTLIFFEQRQTHRRLTPSLNASNPWLEFWFQAISPRGLL